mmetsp:Transcript_47739/g.111594  ORF Transcript_47739/g.111594 Transcript_47739/m.111594 type:complete len:313 (+) Transcript_47739:376-1314(+)
MVAIGHVLGLLRQRLNDIAKSCQRLVDGLRLLHLLTRDFAFLQTLGACEVTKRQLACGHLFGLLVHRLDGNDKDQVGPGRICIHLCRSDMPPVHAHADGLLQLFRVRHLDLHGVLNLHGASRIFLDVQQRGCLPLRLRKEEVHQIIAVELKHRAHDFGFALVRIASKHGEQFLCGAWDKAWHGVVAIHGVGFAGASLTVGKHCDVEAVHRRADETAAVRKNVFLGVVLVEDRVEVVVLGCGLLVLGRTLETERIPAPYCHLLVSFSGNLRTYPCKDTDGAFHVLHLIVIALPKGLLLLESLMDLFRSLLPRL